MGNAQDKYCSENKLPEVDCYQTTSQEYQIKYRTSLSSTITCKIFFKQTREIFIFNPNK